MAHRYVSVAEFRAPYASVAFQGLGENWDRPWPRGRSYEDVSNFRAAYDDGYFQDNTLFGLGDLAATEAQVGAQFPAAFRRFITTGEPMPGWRRDLAAASAQVPQLAWGGIAVGLAGLAYWSYRSWKKAKKG